LAASSRTPGQTTQATATTRDANNNVLTGRAITWSSSNPGVATVSSSGLVTAIAVGSVQIIAACEGKSGAATLTVNNPTPIAVASVSVTLANSSLTPGLTTQATATTRDANNNVLTGRSIAWNSSNNALATVSASGLVTALAVGSVQITATSEGKTGSANLAVVSSPPPPPGSSNEPSGMTKITAREFNAINEDPDWQDEDPAIIADDPTAPSPSKVWRAQYPTGFVAGSGPCNSWLFAPNNLHTVYLSWWFKYSSNWWGQSTGTNKQLYVWTNGDHPTMYVFAEGQDNGELTPYATVQGSRVPRNSELILGPNLVPGARIIRGQWQHFELVLVGNTPGTANGSLDLYLDGVHISSYSGMQFIDGDALWGDVNVDPVWGGLGGSVPQTQTFDVDHFYLSGK
jgi:Big-like domain-containing protein